MSEFILKSFRSRFELADDDEPGTFLAHVSAWGEDLDGDIIEPGAYAKTIADHGGRFPMLWQHDRFTPIGVSVSMAETEKGLAVKGRFVMDVQQAREGHALLKEGALGGFSIGARPVRSDPRADNPYGMVYRELALREFSLVTFPAQPLATVDAMKAERVLRTADELLAKAGRKLSAESRAAIETAIENLTALLASDTPDGDGSDGAAKHDSTGPDVASTLRDLIAKTTRR